MQKRLFLKGLALTGLGLPFSARSMNSWMQLAGNRSALELATDDDFWKAIRGQYELKPDYINLENGYYNILPKEILENFIRHIREVNYQGSYYMRNFRLEDKKNMAAKVAELVGCSSDELVLTRNTTESLDLIIGGFPWNEGDEAVMAEQDYGSMREMFKQVEKRYGVINKIVSIPNHPSSDDEIVNLYASAITSKTKLVMVPHIVNITGQILPIQKICDMAHSKGAEVMVDGAHAVAHFRFKMTDLHCDYYGASLHKWLSAPLGAGMLYVKKENIRKIWPLMAEGDRKEDDIARLNHVGTHPAHTDLAVADAIDFYNRIGAERKETRLRYLQQYWTGKVRNLPNVILNTPADPARSCGIANVGIKGMKPADMSAILLKKYNIYTVAIDTGNVHGCRITPNIFTTLSELDVLVKALTEMG
jgi:selenocysteine lyase/cysteine desulfurase